MLITQLYNSSSSGGLGPQGSLIMQNWYNATNQERQRLMSELAAQMKNKRPADEIAKWLANELGVPLTTFPIP